MESEKINPEVAANSSVSRPTDILSEMPSFEEHKNQATSNYSLEEEQEEHSLRGGKVHEEEHNGSTFLLRDALARIVDSYDEYIGSVEQSHHEKLDYHEVTNYNLAPETDTLDLTWMEPEDVFTFYSSPQHAHVKQMEVNVDNIGSSYLTPGENDAFHDVKIVIHNGDSKENPVAKIKAVKTFLERNGRAFSSDIQFEGFSPVLTKIFDAIKRKDEQK